MATDNKTPARGQRPDTGPALHAAEETAQRLRDALREADQLTQGAAAELVALARSALRCMATPGDGAAMDDARQLLDLVHRRAEELCNWVNVLAEEQGCNYVEDAHHG